MAKSWNRDVDVVVGLQYGDEGKGMVSKLLADHAFDGYYQWTGRVGAQNAEHRFVHGACEFCARILPSAAAFRPEIVAVLGAGHCFRPEHLFNEARHLGVPLHRLYVDRRAMWLREDHAIANSETGSKRGTTGWGVGAALAEKVRRFPETRLIGDCPSMVSMLGDHLTTVSVLLSDWGSGLLEGSQGTMLSLNHGHWPYCTGKDVTAPALLAEMGLPPARLRHVYGCARLVMSRVPGPSGPTGGKEISYQEVESRTGLRIPQHRRLHGDSTRWRLPSGEAPGEERLFDISLDELEYAINLNGVDRLVLTFADYHRPGNYRAVRWQDLHEDTRALVSQIDNTLAPVVLIRTGQGEHDNIWLSDPQEL